MRIKPDVFLPNHAQKYLKKIESPIWYLKTGSTNQHKRVIAAKKSRGETANAKATSFMK